MKTDGRNIKEIFRNCRVFKPTNLYIYMPRAYNYSNHVI